MYLINFFFLSVLCTISTCNNVISYLFLGLLNYLSLIFVWLDLDHFLPMSFYDYYLSVKLWYICTFLYVFCVWCDFLGFYCVFVCIIFRFVFDVKVYKFKSLCNDAYDLPHITNATSQVRYNYWIELKNQLKVYWIKIIILSSDLHCIVL